jgi:colicin import membrane protein
MTTLAMQRDALMPRPPGGTGPGFVLALIVHMLLVAAIAFGVNWRSSEPEGVQAELWASMPQIAAPKAVEPEPTPVPPEPKPEPKPLVKPEPAPVPKQETRPDAQIAIEKAKREDQRKKKEEAEKLAQQQKAEKVKLEKDEKRKKEQEDQKLAEFHAKEMKRILGQAGGAETKVEGNSTKTAGPSASYAGRIKARIRPNITFTDPISGNPLATVLVKLAPDGTIIDKRLVKSSGVPAWDAAVMRAIEKTEILPRDIDGRVPPPFEIDFRPQD